MAVRLIEADAPVGNGRTLAVLGEPLGLLETRLNPVGVEGGAESGQDVEVPNLPLAAFLDEVDGILAPHPVRLGVLARDGESLVAGRDPDALGRLAVGGNLNDGGRDGVLDQEARGARGEGVTLDVCLPDCGLASPGANVFGLEDDVVPGAPEFVDLEIVAAGRVIVGSAAHDLDDLVAVLDTLDTLEEGLIVGMRGHCEEDVIQKGKISEIASRIGFWFGDQV